MDQLLSASNFEQITFNGGPKPQPAPAEGKGGVERKAGFEEFLLRKADTEFQGSLDSEVDDNALLNYNGNKPTTQESDSSQHYVYVIYCYCYHIAYCTLLDT